MGNLRDVKNRSTPTDSHMVFYDALPLRCQNGCCGAGFFIIIIIFIEKSYFMQFLFLMYLFYCKNIQIQGNYLHTYMKISRSTIFTVKKGGYIQLQRSIK